MNDPLLDTNSMRLLLFGHLNDSLRPVWDCIVVLGKKLWWREGARKLHSRPNNALFYALGKAFFFSLGHTGSLRDLLFIINDIYRVS